MITATRNNPYDQTTYLLNSRNGWNKSNLLIFPRFLVISNLP